ncbi:hypothetical protein [Paraburkholderia caledonica]|uniref:hypothetical protein n=1 Tax=Paraburkholderia caledonica TaxID=134536 RepID=UPI000377CBD3|nr:hypothetical protein [Paraburkholderia caledonica]
MEHDNNNDDNTVPQTMLSDQQIDELLAKAITCLEAGYFDGALRLCEKLERHGKKSRDAVSHAAWLTRVYLGGRHREDALKMWDVTRAAAHLPGGQGLAEGALLAAHVGRVETVAACIEETLRVAAAQNGVLVTFHPTALLQLAEFAFDRLNDKFSALKLVNCALGFRAAFLVLDDVERLGRLLSRLNAPLPLWVDWGAIFIRHISLSTDRHWLHGRKIGDPKFVKWAKEQGAASEGVLKRTLSVGPPQLHEMLVRLAPQVGAPELGIVLHERFSGTKDKGDAAPTEPLWFDPQVLRLRYFWHDMLTEDEQHMLRNGEWAMFNTPTPDFSMALAQWWRMMESVLKRALAKPIHELFAANPEWIAWDRDNLGERVKKRETIFIDKLAEQNKWQRLTLGDMVLILRKCISDEPSKSEDVGGGSRLRKEAKRFLNKHRDQLGPLVLGGGRWTHAPQLTAENVDIFRNQSSHNESVNIIESSIGRWAGKHVLDLLFATYVKQWGFTPTMYLDLLTAAEEADI